MVLCGGVVKAHMKRCEMEDILISTLQRGVPPDLTRVNFCEHVVDLIYHRIKYQLQVHHASGPEGRCWRQRVLPHHVATEWPLTHSGHAGVPVDVPHLH